MLIALSILLFLLVVLDTIYTIRLLHERPADESNSLIRWLNKKYGPVKASFLGVCGPTAVWIIGCAVFNLPLVYAWYVGIRTYLGLTQVWKLVAALRLPH